MGGARNLFSLYPIDMQGPELRIGSLAGAVILQEGQLVLLGGEKDNPDKTKHSGSTALYISVPSAAVAAMEDGDEILLNDGKLALQVLEHCGTYVKGKVLRGGMLSGHKSLKITGKQVDMPVLTEHDLANISLAKEYGVTGLMQPFVQSGAELVQVRQALRACGAEKVKILAKIENKAAVANLDSILQEADVIVIARGDLGNDMPLWELPAVQKDIAYACRYAGKPFIVVTQMLASMEEYPVPTRAEVSDIFNAVTDGAWGVMITGESAVGKYPVEAVRFLANTAKNAEKWLEKRYEY